MDYNVVVTDERSNTYTTFLLGPSPADKTVMNTMVNFINDINFGLPGGNFELDRRDGELRYKFPCLCAGIDAPYDRMIALSICNSMMAFQKYEEGILGILFGCMSAEEALACCEKRTDSILARLEALQAKLETLEQMDSAEENTYSDADSGILDVSFSFEDFLRMMVDNEYSEHDEENGPDGI